MIWTLLVVLLGWVPLYWCKPLPSIWGVECVDHGFIAESLAIAKTLDARADDTRSYSMDLAYSMMGVCIRDYHSRRPDRKYIEQISTCSHIPSITVPRHFSLSGHGMHDGFFCPQFLPNSCLSPRGVKAIALHESYSTILTC